MRNRSFSQAIWAGDFTVKMETWETKSVSKAVLHDFCLYIYLFIYFLEIQICPNVIVKAIRTETNINVFENTR